MSVAYDPERGFLCLLPNRSWARYTRRHHLGALGKFGPLVVAERCSGWVGRGRPGAGSAASRTGAGGEAGGLPVAHVVRPRTPWPRAFGRLRAKSWAASLRRGLHEAGLEDPVVVLTSPSQRRFFDLDVPRRAVCFELSDEFSLYMEPNRRRRAESYGALVETVRRSDIVFATAKSLAEKYSVYNPNTHWVPNTAVPEDFRVEESTPRLASLDAGARPVIGFVGGLNPWIDVRLLVELRRLRPHWRIVFSASPDGPAEFLDSPEMRELRSVGMPEFLGWVEYDRLREFLAGVDVCALFHRADDLGRFLHPNKLYQYLASGKPLVSTAFLPELDEFGGLVRVAPSVEAFVEAVEEALAERGGAGEEARLARIECARRSRPEARAARKVDLIDRFLERAGPSRPFAVAGSDVRGARPTEGVRHRSRLTAR